MDSEVTTALPSPRRARHNLITAAFPATAALTAPARWFIGLGMLALAGAVVADALHVLFGVAAGWETAMRGPVPALANVVAAAIVVIRAAVERERRAVWILLAAGFCSYAVAFVLWGCWLEFTPHPSEPSVADLFWSGMYVFCAACLIVAARGYSPRGLSLKVWLDGMIAATALAAVGMAFVVPPLIHSGDANHGSVMTDMLYPLADLVVGVLIVAVIGVRGWQLDRKWLVLVAGFGCWLTADTMCAIQVVNGALSGHSSATLMYMIAFACVAAGAWQPERHPAKGGRSHWSTLVLPSVFTLAAPTILIYDHFSRVPLSAFVLTLVALVVAMLRLSLALRDSLHLRDVQHDALTDELTDLPNRRMFFGRLDEGLADAREQRASLTLLMLDLDNFKQINDTLGHEAGDELLRLIGPRLARAAHAGEVTARLGGDEFAVLLKPNSTAAAAATVATAVLDALNEPLEVHGLALRLTASVGIASFPDDAADPHTLLKCADVAMYEAKRSRRGWERYSSERDANTRERLELSAELAAALENDEIEVAFQPIAHAGSRQILSGEALVRWRRPDGTLRPPSEFLEAAELAGLSRPLTRRVLKLALENVCAWREAGHMISVSVNTTVADLLDSTFPDEVAALLRLHDLGGDALKIEVTESSILANQAQVSSVLQSLRRHGVGIALDDFGTGYSSLSHLRQLPVDRLKIDRSFVTNMRSDATNAAIVYATIELAHSLKLRVIAEGVEDEETWQALRELGCDAVQGFTLSRPVEPDEFRAQLEARRAEHLARTR